MARVLVWMSIVSNWQAYKGMKGRLASPALNTNREEPAICHAAGLLLYFV